MRISRKGQYDSYYDLQNQKSKHEDMKPVKETEGTKTKREEKNTFSKQQNNEDRFLNLDDGLLENTSNEIERAISDMKKDRVLQQYNFFVSSAENSTENSDKDVMPLENFDL